MHSPYFPHGELCSTSFSVEYLHILFGIFLHWRFVSSPPLYVLLFICTNSDSFIVFIDFLLTLLQLWPLSTFSVCSCIWHVLINVCVCVCKTSFFYGAISFFRFLFFYVCWGMFYGPQCSLSWWIFYVSLRKMCMLSCWWIEVVYRILYQVDWWYY